MTKKQNSHTLQRWFDLPAILLLMVVLSTAFTRLTATGWTSDLDVTRAISNLGLAAGVALGFSRFSPRWSAFFASVYGAFAVTWRVGLTLGEGVPWRERLFSMAGRFETIIEQLAQQKPAPENLLFIALMGVMFWILSAHAGYMLVRHAHPWLTILPTGLAIIIIHHYEVIQPDIESVMTGRVGWVIAYLLFALLLAARLAYLHRRSGWIKDKIFIPPYLGFDVGRFVLIGLIVILLFSWNAPALAQGMPSAARTYQVFSDQFRDLRNILSNLTASLRVTVGIISDHYGPNLALGRGAPLSDNILFTVQVPQKSLPGVRFYWKARVYNHYDGGWTSSLNATRALGAGDLDLDFPDMLDDFEEQYTFTFDLKAPVSTLFTTGQPTLLSRPTQAELAFNPDGTVELATVRAVPTLRGGDTYSIRSSFNQLTVSALRQAGQDYPAWIMERYLQVPPTITERTRELARQIAAGEDNPYDISAAVTNYLRLNIDYAESVPAVPGGAEAIDWFLFEHRQGFCNYYASSEVIMLRSLGIPARLAVGYAPGEYAEAQPVYTVRYKNAHAWPEVYFPGYGWVEFEPTASLPALVRPLGESQGSALPNRDSNLPPEDDPNANDDRLADQEDRLNPDDVAGAQRSAPFIMATAALTAVLVLLGVTLVMRNKTIQRRLPGIPVYLEKSLQRLGFRAPGFLAEWALRARLTPMQRAYLELNLALRRLGQHPAPTDTPSERQVSLVGVLPPASQPAESLVKEYQAETYNRQAQGDLYTAQKASREIRSLSWKAYLRKALTEANPRRGSER